MQFLYSARKATWNLKISGNEKEVIFLSPSFFVFQPFLIPFKPSLMDNLKAFQGFPNPRSLCKMPGFLVAQSMFRKIQKDWSQPKPSFTTITGISLEKIFWVALMTNEAQLLPVMKPQEPFVWGTKRGERFTGRGTIGGAFNYFFVFSPRSLGKMIMTPFRRIFSKRVQTTQLGKRGVMVLHFGRLTMSELRG